jgi:uncharacterized phage protein (TIGR02218 family)
VKLTLIGSDFAQYLRLPSVGLCLCWHIVRSDGVQVFLTNHDKELVYDLGGTLRVFEPTSAFSGSAVESKEGMTVDNMNVMALDSPALREEDLIAGKYDDAQITIYLAQWTHPQTGLLALKKGYFGEIKGMGQSFDVEVRGLSERIQRRQGLTYSLECSANLGDARCTRSLVDLTFTGTVTSQIHDDRTFVISVSQPDGYFQYGTLRFLSGNNANRKVEVLGYQASRITLMERMPFPVSFGDQLEVVAGCDKLASTCKTKFNNLLNFRGFPFMPTEEEALETPNVKN